MRNPAVPQAGVQYRVVLLWVHYGNDEVDDVARSAELTSIALGSKYREQILEGIAQPLRVVVCKLVNDL